MTSGRPEIVIGGRPIGRGLAPYVIAEMSGNHGHSLERAMDLIGAAHEAGADAVKLQTYTPDTLTIKSARDEFRLGENTLWSGRTLWDLYGEAFTPWEWFPALADEGRKLGMSVFSTPFDSSAVEFLEQYNPPAHKIASFELVDLPLIRLVAATGRPMILSTGMATKIEIDEAVDAARGAGTTEVALLRCNSSYPASPDEMDLLTIPDMIDTWEVPVGLSDHTLGIAAAVAAVALGACIIEKHITLSRNDPGPDSAFSLEPDQFRQMVDGVREASASLGGVRYGPSRSEEASLRFRRSLFAVRDIDAGERFTSDNVRSIRPASGLPPRDLDRLLGMTASKRIERGTPLAWDMVATPAS